MYVDSNGQVIVLIFGLDLWVDESNCYIDKSFTRLIQLTIKYIYVNLEISPTVFN